MYFEIVGEVTHVETFASGSTIRELARLRKFCGRGRWRKRKGIARVRLSDGSALLLYYVPELDLWSGVWPDRGTDGIVRRRLEPGRG